MAAIAPRSPVVFPATSRHTATVIFSHGLGDSGAGWADAAEYLRLRKQRLDEVKFILPNAPRIPITVNGGFRMPGWFDIKALGPSVESLASSPVAEDQPGIIQSQAYFHSLIQEEIAAGIPADRIVLGGFSQGGAMSIFSGLTAPVKIAGIVGLSSWLLLHQSFNSFVPAGDINKNTPVLMGHGNMDPVVGYPLAKESEKALKEMGYDVTFKTYNGMEHSACPEELDDLEDFLATRLPPKGKDEL